MHPFRFAVQASVAPDMAAWRERARHAETLGYSCLYVPDHLGEQFGPLVALTVAAEATTTLKVGPLVLDNDYRHPVVLAKEIATLDLAAEGRLEVGLGAGWLRSDYDESGMAYDAAAVRVARLAEGVAIMKALWANGTATFSGQHYHVEQARCLPQPYTRPHPPLLIGGGGRRVLELAAREADIVGINPSMRAGHIGPEAAASAVAERYDERLGWLRQAAGERFDAIELQVLTAGVMVVPDRQTTAEQLAPLFGVTPEAALQTPLALIGTVGQMCDNLIERRQRWGLSYIVVHDTEMDAFAAVVARLSGQ